MHKRLTALSAAAILGLSLGSPVLAESMEQIKANEKQIQQERAVVSEKLGSAQERIAAVLADLEELEETVGKTEKALDLNERQLHKVEKSITASKEKVERLNGDIGDLEVEVDKRYEIVRSRIVAYQQGGGDIGFLDVLAESQSFSQFASRSRAVARISDSDIELMKDLEKSERKLTERKKKVDVELNAQKEKRAELEGVRSTIAGQKKLLEAKKRKLAGKRKELNGEKSTLKLKDTELAAVEKQIKADLKAKKEALAIQQAKKEKERQLEAEREQERKRQAQLKKQEAMREQSSRKTVPSYNSREKKRHEIANAEKPPVQNSDSATVQTDSDPSQVSGLSTAIEAGFTQIGTPYVWGGKKPGGFDCSGFVSWAYRQAGYDLPSSTAGLQYVGEKVSYSNAQPGDMVFFNTYKTNGHVGIYLGNDRFLGAQDSGLDVAYMGSGYWKNHFTGHVRRVQ